MIDELFWHACDLIQLSFARQTICIRQQVITVLWKAIQQVQRRDQRSAARNVIVEIEHFHCATLCSEVRNMRPPSPTKAWRILEKLVDHKIFSYLITGFDYKPVWLRGLARRAYFRLKAIALL